MNENFNKIHKHIVTEDSDPLSMPIGEFLEQLSVNDPEEAARLRDEIEKHYDRGLWGRNPNGDKFSAWKASRTPDEIEKARKSLNSISDLDWHTDAFGRRSMSWYGDDGADTE